jgi:hypothetical protein
MCLISFSSFAQKETKEALLGLPGDDLDLYATLDLFQKSKTIEDFEKALNAEKAGMVNLDLNNDGKVDFIKVETKKDGDNFLFILQDPINEKETQDVAVITVSKDTAGKVSMQIIGDEKLYGKDYVVEPRSEPTESVTANPAYIGDDPATVNVPATTQVLVVETVPIVQYVYSPVYVPYYPPYHYGYYPSYWAPVAIISIGIYRSNHYYHHNNYYGGRGNTNVNINVNNRNSYNNYNNNSRNSSRSVNNNIKNGNFKTSGQRGSRPSNRASTANRASAKNKGANANRVKNNAGSAANRGSKSKGAATNRAIKSRTSPSRSTSNRSSGSRSMGSSHRSSNAGISRGGGRGRRRH